MLRRRPAARLAAGPHLLVRVHVLRALRRASPGWRVPELRWRVRSPAAADRPQSSRRTPPRLCESSGRLVVGRRRWTMPPTIDPPSGPSRASSERRRRSVIESLADLLIDAVQSGASVGFLAPVERPTADLLARHFRFPACQSRPAAVGGRTGGNSPRIGATGTLRKREWTSPWRSAKAVRAPAARGQGLATLLLRRSRRRRECSGDPCWSWTRCWRSGTPKRLPPSGLRAASSRYQRYATTTPDGELFPTVYYFEPLGCMKKMRVGSFVGYRSTRCRGAGRLRY